MSNEYETWKAYAENLQAQRENDSATIKELQEALDRQTARLIERETELRKALATQPAVGEPVAWLYDYGDGNAFLSFDRLKPDMRQGKKEVSLYAAPPAAAIGCTDYIGPHGRELLSHMRGEK